VCHVYQGTCPSAFVTWQWTSLIFPWGRTRQPWEDTHEEGWKVTANIFCSTPYGEQVGKASLCQVPGAPAQLTLWESLSGWCLRDSSP
jgi:hypothetical protein